MLIGSDDEKDDVVSPEASHAGSASAAGASASVGSVSPEEKKKRGRLKGTSKSKKEPDAEEGGARLKRTPSSKALAVSDTEQKCCSFCNKTLPVTAFYESQSKCKECSNLLKSMERTAKMQGWSQWEERRGDMKFVKELSKAYRKAQAEPRRNGQRIKFAFHEFQLSYLASEGTQKLKISSMMSKQVFLDYAVTSEGGPGRLLYRAAGVATLINNVQTRCIVKGEAQKSPPFWRFSGGL